MKKVGSSLVLVLFIISGLYSRYDCSIAQCLVNIRLGIEAQSLRNSVLGSARIFKLWYCVCARSWGKTFKK